MNYKEYFKRRLNEMAMRQDLYGDLLSKGNAGNVKSLRSLESMARSPHLYELDPTTGTPRMVPGVRIHPRLLDALSNAAHGGGSLMDPGDIATIRDFINTHGDFVGARASDYSEVDASPGIFGTVGPGRVQAIPGVSKPREYRSI